MTIRKGYTFAVALLVLACSDVLLALDLAKADDEADERATASNHAKSGQARSSWLQQQFPEFSSWLLQKLLDDSLEFVAFGCCVCWVCTHASHKFFSAKAGSGEWDSREIFWELLPFFILVFGSVVLLLQLGAAVLWDVSAVLLLLPVLCAFGLRRYPSLLKWLLCCGLLLQILHHGIEHGRSFIETRPCTVQSSVSNLQKQEDVTKKNFLVMNEGSTYQQDETMYHNVKIKGEIQEKEITMLKSTLDIQTRRIEAMSQEISMLNLEKDIQTRTIQELTDRNTFLEHNRIIR